MHDYSARFHYIEMLAAIQREIEMVRKMEMPKEMETGASRR
jgi:hypothetical protein